MSDQRSVFLAGRRALDRIRAKGLDADDVQVVAGAAGGPKWLVLGHLDRLLFGHWLRERSQPLFLLGSSIGSWRFAADSCADPAAAIDRMEDAYIHQSYAHEPTPAEVSEKSLAIIDQTLGSSGPREVLSHPSHRLNLVAVRSRHLLGFDQRLVLALGLGTAVAANLLNRSLLKLFFQQTLFGDSRNRPPFAYTEGTFGARADLTPGNLKQALLASGSIPYVMAGVSDIPHAAPGIYRDGGAVDYHLDVPFGLKGSGVVLYPHFSQRVIPGWFDKALAWRRASAENMADVLIVAPSDDFVSRLPNGKITDRSDFYTYAGDDKGRFACWQKVADAGKMLADDFMEAVESGKIRQRVAPLT
ncbi:MAG: hypothetical protein CR984_05980 [Proteobacteria bacterium]|nr:MAG: hypothetical protein CR984_05980 [Pseudomonadota bacterium]PIE67549.1 MAG: hypothetical protein CSA23_03745 [Deltaproteobacteria bacterium]